MAKRKLKKREPVRIVRKNKRRATVTPRATSSQEDELPNTRAARRSIASERAEAQPQPQALEPSEARERDIAPTVGALPPLPIATLCWTGEGKSKWWNTLEFKQGDATPIDSLPLNMQRQMIEACAGSANWKVEYVLPDLEAEPQ
jgi:hypothetical protein